MIDERQAARFARDFEHVVIVTEASLSFLGVGVRNPHGVRLNSTAWPTSSWRPRRGDSIACTMPIWRT